MIAFLQNVPPGQFVLLARATARSTGPDVFYSLNTEGEDHKMFHIDRLTGNLTTKETFDREQQAVYDVSRSRMEA